MNQSESTLVDTSFSIASVDTVALASPALPAALPKAVAVSFSNCATRSLARLFARSGHRSVHQKLPHRWRGRRKLGGIMRANQQMGKPLFSSIEDYTFYGDLIDSNRH